jgi:hypothetical protein
MGKAKTGGYKKLIIGTILTVVAGVSTYYLTTRTERPKPTDTIKVADNNQNIHVSDSGRIGSINHLQIDQNGDSDNKVVVAGDNNKTEINNQHTHIYPVQQTVKPEYINKPVPEPINPEPTRPEEIVQKEPPQKRAAELTGIRDLTDEDKAELDMLDPQSIRFVRFFHKTFDNEAIQYGEKIKTYLISSRGFPKRSQSGMLIGKYRSYDSPSKRFVIKQAEDRADILEIDIQTKM